MTSLLTHNGTYRSAAWTGRDRVEVRDFDVQELGPDDVRVRVAYSGICGSDLHAMRAPEDFGVAEQDLAISPGTPGHEFSGVVDAVGDAVTEVQPGDRVACLPRIPCGACGACRLGDVVRCSRKIRAPRGGWAQVVVRDKRFLRSLVPGLSLRAAALAEPTACCLRGLDLARARSVSTALVIGGGPMGLITAALALRNGFNDVVLSEPQPYRRALAERLGATAVDPGEGPVAELAADVLGGAPEVVFEAVGHPSTVEDAVDAVAVGGTVVVLGVAGRDDVARIRPWVLFDKEMAIVGAWGVEDTFERAMRWLRSADIDVLASHDFALEDISTALDVARSGLSSKVLLRPTEVPA